MNPINSFHLSQTQAWLNSLHSVGCVVIKNILSSEQVLHAQCLYFDWLQSLNSGINRNDVQTWQDENWPSNSSLGFTGTYGGCHTHTSWFIRTHPNTQKAFQAIYSTPDLITSFDTIITWRPWWDNPKWHPKVENLHVDQNPTQKKGFHCVQGMVPLIRVKEVGGLMVVPFSNTDAVQKELAARYPYRGDWVELHSEDEYCSRGVLVQCQAGDLILWDSRTIHGGCVREPQQQYKDKNRKSIVRLAVTVTMVPRTWCTPHVAERRKNAFTKRIGLNHWPHQYCPSGMGSIAANIKSAQIQYQWPKLQGDISKIV